jgi:hypothetical protein
MHSETEACLLTKGTHPICEKPEISDERTELASHLAAARALKTDYNSLIKTAAEHFLWADTNNRKEDTGLLLLLPRTRSAK